jgi:hypothetical protein
VVVLLTTEPFLDPLNTVKEGIAGIGGDYALGVKGLRFKRYKVWLFGGEEARVRTRAESRKSVFILSLFLLSRLMDGDLFATDEE